ncbi:hypothetical protein BYT27DRAFT_7112506 [Phlegmacium glaucopus]|nr:hypothetical protein BYT27DRAFT_7112506 [Phlegmacium glaucopus]
MSQSTLRSIALAPPLKLSLSIPTGVQQTHSFSSSPVHSPKGLTLLTILQYRSILARFIAYTDWSDLYHLFCTCQHVRNLFRDTDLRDVILTRYVVGYGYCLRNRDLNHFQDMEISILDLDLLLISQRFGLHRYPMHALRILTSMYSTFEDDDMTAKLVALTAAHSRFVLFLQSLAHSSSEAMPLEPEELRWKAQLMPAQNIRELTFPTPLAYVQVPVSVVNSPAMMSQPPSKKLRRISMFGRNSNLPPAREPRTLKMYSNTWRRSAYLAHPHRRFATNTSSDSSTTGSHSSIAGHDSFSSTSSRTQSLHDLSGATCRNRAPILRVFVPCTTLDDDDESLISCERQLVDSGLWPHLSTGDIVCNFGFVPPNAEDTSSEVDDFSPTDYLSQSRSDQRRGSADASSQVKWLIFDGQFLIPYSPPNLLPLDDALTLPSPFYYAHITHPFANFTYVIDQFPICDDIPELTLIYSTNKVPSPHSPKGCAFVKKYTWIARVVRFQKGHEGDVGKGWFGEWTLEGEGTKEGKQFLLDALAGSRMDRRVWELVREKSGGGKLWLK